MMFFWHFLKGLNCCVLRMKETRKGSSKDCFKSLTEFRFILIVLESKIFKTELLRIFLLAKMIIL